MRIAVLAVLLSLVTPSVARITCGWDCIEQRGAAQAAGCHDHDEGERNKLLSGLGTRCHEDLTSIADRGVSWTPNWAAVVEISVPTYSRKPFSSDTITSRTATDSAGTRLTLIPLRI